MSMFPQMPPTDSTYIILTSDYQEAVHRAKELNIEITQWRWLRDRFKEPLVYKRIDS